MSEDKRTVTTDALETLGMVHTREEKRDAIHLAVEPVTAQGTLYPGNSIDVRYGMAVRVPQGEGLGIVDPFLLRPVKDGERFWFIMYPRQVRSLRHVWTHPSFPDEPEVSAPKPAGTIRERITVLAAMMDLSYDALMAGAKEHLATGRYMHFGEDLDYSWPVEEFWRLYAAETGENPGDASSFFSCSC